MFALLMVFAIMLAPPARALSDDHGGDSHSGGSAGKGKHGSHSSGGHGGHSRGQGGAHKGNPHEGHPSGRGGGRAVKSDVLNGRRPIWAAGGIPEVELGRLNVVRAPSSVLERARFNAEAEFSPEMASFYTMSIDDVASVLATDQASVTRFHSPLQNLALYHEVMVYGRSGLLATPATSKLELASILLGSAADKNVPITQDTVTAVNRMLGLIDLPSDQSSLLAADAERVRAALLAGHGEEGTDHGH